jgi:ABC-2 type transport system ATP-binding protein
MTQELAPVEVEVHGLGKRYGDVQAVDDVSFSVPAGTVTAILGGNGAGKSTSLRLMLGLARGSGNTTYAGRALLDHDDPFRVVGAFLGAPAFHAGRTARNHLRCLGAGTGLEADRVEEILLALGLDGRATDRPRTYSTGLKQRLGIAAAMLADPSLLVLDEPTNGLDPHAVIGMRDLLKDHARRGGSVLIATHILGEVELVADRAVVMAGGRVVEAGQISSLLGADSHAPLSVHCDAPERLAQFVLAQGASTRSGGDGQLVVEGLPARTVAELARAADVLVWGLAPIRPSMEEYFVSAVPDILSAGLVR